MDFSYWRLCLLTYIGGDFSLLVRFYHNNLETKYRSFDGSRVTSGKIEKEFSSYATAEKL